MKYSHIGELAALAAAFCWTVSAFGFESAGKRTCDDIRDARCIFRTVFGGVDVDVPEEKLRK
jgi:hypothetical protein